MTAIIITTEGLQEFMIDKDKIFAISFHKLLWPDLIESLLYLQNGQICLISLLFAYLSKFHQILDLSFSGIPFYLSTFYKFFPLKK